MALHLRACMALAMLSAVSSVMMRPGSSRRRKVEKPNILYVLLDDFGWGDAGWHWESGEAPTGLKTPKMTALVREEGVELDRMYGFKVCSPSRSSIQSGRHPLQVNVLNIHATHWNPKDNVSGFAGIPREMTGMAEVIRDAGYETYMFGKWDVGLATWRHTPAGRGYNHAFGYWGHGSDYWTMSNSWCGGSVDVFKDSNGMPAKRLMKRLNVYNCSQEMQAGCTYADSMYTHAVKETLRTRPRTKPFFVFWSMHLVHDPFQVPKEYIEPWKHIEDETLRIYHGMVTLADEEVGSVMDLLKSEGLWDSTVVVVHSDNGGPMGVGNNAPLRGGKFTNWDGGIRLMAFVTGGFLPWRARGTKQEFFMQVSDWYATFAHLAGVDDVHDARAAAFDLPPVNSKNAWGNIIGDTTEPIRDHLVIGDGPQFEHKGAWVGGLIRGRYKLIVGEILKGKAALNKMSAQPSSALTERAQTDVLGEMLALDSDVPFNLTDSLHLEADGFTDIMQCGRDPSSGCLFDIFDDPAEDVNIAHNKGELFWELLRQMDTHQKAVFDPERGTDQAGYFCEVADRKFKGFLGPFVPGLDKREDFADAADEEEDSADASDAEENSTHASATSEEDDSADASDAEENSTHASATSEVSEDNSTNASAESEDVEGNSTKASATEDVEENSTNASAVSEDERETRRSRRKRRTHREEESTKASATEDVEENSTNASAVSEDERENSTNASAVSEDERENSKNVSAVSEDERETRRSRRSRRKRRTPREEESTVSEDKPDNSTEASSMSDDVGENLTKASATEDMEEEPASASGTSAEAEEEDKRDNSTDASATWDVVEDDSADDSAEWEDVGENFTDPSVAWLMDPSATLE